MRATAPLLIPQHRPQGRTYLGDDGRLRMAWFGREGFRWPCQLITCANGTPKEGRRKEASSRNPVLRPNKFPYQAVAVDRYGSACFNEPCALTSAADTHPSVGEH